MSIRFRTILFVLMSFGLFFGFLHQFVPGAADYNFERLHIFLFNLCSGGTIVMYYSTAKKRATPRVMAFGMLSFAYALFAFFEIYIPAMAIAVVLALIAESVRIKLFTVFPVNFFRKDTPVNKKFHQASLLCLSLGLLISAFVILNNVYMKWVYFPKLTLNTFFLGFSFPLSLITMHVMFLLMKDDYRPLIKVLKNAGFWIVNLGVIIFFIYILVEKLGHQLVVTTILTLTVVMIFVLFAKLGIDVQQKNFLVSGMVFLLFTAITGVAYIVLSCFPEYYDPNTGRFLLRTHSFVSLYGWNLSGLAVICRYDDFPILLHSKYIIILHWLTVLILAPLGTLYVPAASLAVVCYTVFLYVMFSSKGLGRFKKMNKRNRLKENGTITFL